MVSGAEIYPLEDKYQHSCHNEAMQFQVKLTQKMTSVLMEVTMAMNLSAFQMHVIFIEGREVPISMSSAVHMRRFMEYGYEIRARSKATLRMLFAGNFTIDEGIAWAQQLRLLFYSYKIPNARHNFI
ncbi:hypothetical protein T10_7055 [Trichinella papuae]|uniref:Uncharacterized protein n=1 Tax=Trichinella papuae TaxID=268474 RepID=A0A0V1N286_9BILA|nr:hypothetical protein T10_7055 [Trichinella papuae]